MLDPVDQWTRTFSNIVDLTPMPAPADLSAAFIVSLFQPLRPFGATTRTYEELAMQQLQFDRSTPPSARDFAHRLTIGPTLFERGLRMVTGTDGGSPGCPNLSPGDPLQHLDVLRLPTLVMIGGRVAHRVQQQPA